MLFVTLSTVTLGFEPGGEILSVIIQKPAIEQYFPLMLLIMLSTVVIGFEPNDKI